MSRAVREVAIATGRNELLAAKLPLSLVSKAALAIVLARRLERRTVIQLVTPCILGGNNNASNMKTSLNLSPVIKILRTDMKTS
jgi:hypothetical protein